MMMVRARHWLESKTVSIFVLCAVILSLLLATVSAAKQYSYTHCVANYNNQVNTYLITRRATIDKQNDVYTAVILAVARAENESEVTAALQKFDAEQTLIDQNNQSHPLPNPPSEVCH